MVYTTHIIQAGNEAFTTGYKISSKLCNRKSCRAYMLELPTLNSLRFHWSFMQLLIWGPYWVKVGVLRETARHTVSWRIGFVKELFLQFIFSALHFLFCLELYLHTYAWHAKIAVFNVFLQTYCMLSVLPMQQPGCIYVIGHRGYKTNFCLLNTRGAYWELLPMNDSMNKV